MIRPRKWIRSCEAREPGLRFVLAWSAVASSGSAVRVKTWLDRDDRVDEEEECSHIWRVSENRTDTSLSIPQLHDNQITLRLKSPQ